MKKIIWTFGLITGSILVAMMLGTTTACYTNPEFESNDVIGYSVMLVTFSFIFVGIKRHRDKNLNGIISFGRAFRAGLLVTTVASCMYLLVWLVEYYVFIPDFLDSYTHHVLYQAKIGGATPAEIDAKAAEMASFAEMYENPAFVVLATLMEVFPIGLVVSLISALILRKKPEGTGDGEIAVAAGSN